MKRVMIITISVLSIMGVLSIVRAGTLSPPSSPDSTGFTLGEIFNPLASASYDSSGIASESAGSVIEISKCILEKMHGGDC